MKCIIEGADLPKVLQENRVRISRGTIKVTPLTEEVMPETADTKDVAVTDDKKPVKDTKSPKKAKK